MYRSSRNSVATRGGRRRGGRRGGRVRLARRGINRGVDARGARRGVERVDVAVGGRAAGGRAARGDVAELGTEGARSVVARGIRARARREDRRQRRQHQRRPRDATRVTHVRVDSPRWRSVRAPPPVVAVPRRTDGKCRCGERAASSRQRSRASHHRLERVAHRDDFSRANRRVSLTNSKFCVRWAGASYDVQSESFAATRGISGKSPEPRIERLEPVVSFRP